MDISSRRRTHFGQTSDRDLIVLVGELRDTDNLIGNLERRGQDVPEGLIIQNAKARVVRMAAEAELARRLERQTAAKERR